MKLQVKVGAFCAAAVLGLGLTSTVLFVSANALEARSAQATRQREQLKALHHLSTRTGDTLMASSRSLITRAQEPLDHAADLLEVAVADLRAVNSEPDEHESFEALAHSAELVAAATRRALTSHDGDMPRTMTALGDLAEQGVFFKTAPFIEHEINDIMMTDELANEALTTLRSLAIALPLVLLVLLGLGTLAFLPRFTRGVRTLADAARRVGGGDLDTTVALGGHDELTHVGDAFNAMSHNLRSARAELIAARERAEHSDRAKSEFLANMSHEIRTPMHGVLGLADMLAATDLNAAQREQLGLLKGSGETLLDILNGILDFSKIEAGREEVRARAFGLGGLLGELAKSMAVAADEKGVELVLGLRPDVPEALVGDDIKLRQIVVNLVHNAIKFTDVGEVVIDVAVVARDGARAELELRVVDTGIGIPHERQAAIFDAFTQADGSITRRYGGTGLGLAIVARLVRLLDGHIRVESEVGRGAAFIVRLPFGVAAEQPSVPTPVLTELAGLRVLVVDDRESTRRVLGELVRAFGMVPEMRVDVDGGLRALDSGRTNNQPFQVVLVDAALAGQSGLDLIAHIQKNPRLGGAKVVLLSPTEAPVQIARCRALGVEAWATKPVQSIDLMTAILRARGRVDLLASAPILEREERAPAIRKLHILAAEDNPVNQRVLTGVLGRRGHEVTIVGNGTEAVTRARAERWDLVLMDVQMPDMDGLAATVSIRAHERVVGGHLPILGMTAHTQASDRDRCLVSGMDGYLAKPVSAKELIDTVERFALLGINAPTERMIDEQHVSLQVGGDRTLFDETLAGFVEQAPRLMRDLVLVVAEGDLVACAQLVHTLKGSLGLVGARRSLGLVARIEGHIASGERDAVRATLDELMSTMTATVDAADDALVRHRGVAIDGRDHLAAE